MRLKATARRRRLAPQRPEDVDHVRALRRVVLARHPHRSRGDKHRGITLMLVPLDQPGITINGIWTMGDERTNEVFIDDVFVPDEYVVGEVNHGFQYISQALDLERFTMFTLLADQAAPRPARATTSHTEDGRRRAAAATTRSSASGSPSSPPTPRWRACSACAFVAESMKGGAAPTSSRREYKLFATELSKRLAERVDGHRRPGRAAAGARPRTRRWRAGPSRRTATP